MDTKEWLNHGRTLNREIKALRDALSRAEALSSFDNGQNTDKYINGLSSKISQLSQVNSDIISAIYSVKDDILRILLIERFINNKTWDNVAIRLGYDFYYVIKRLYPKAVAEVEKVLH